MRNTITIHIEAGQWVATYCGPHAAMIQDLFKTRTLPTAYTRKTAAAFVAAELTKLNPGIEIIAPRQCAA